MIHTARVFLKEIRIEHTLFALPFAYVGAVMAAHGLPTFAQFAWITLAVFGARTAAMAANRYFDRKLDLQNPRTAQRAVASGKLAPAVMLWAMGLGIALLIVSAALLNPLCLMLLPLAAAGILIYPLCKRFTWLVHFVLGAVDAFAPLGAFIAVSGTITVPAFLLFIAVTVWVAGFDILYALMDYRYDVAQGINSIPARFGERSGRIIPIALHVAMTLALLGAGILAHAGAVYYAGVALAAVLVIYEKRLIALAKDMFALNDRIFVTNMAFSVLFLGTTLASYLGR
ncbi:MAG: putative 4-hydroxybenzoate polyprenyltransferase [Candidatus Velthaea sp.]